LATESVRLQVSMVLAVGPTNSAQVAKQPAAYTASFAAFTGRALTIFRAGFALNTVGSFVNGLMPFRSLVAGFLTTTNEFRKARYKKNASLFEFFVAHGYHAFEDCLHVFLAQLGVFSDLLNQLRFGHLRWHVVSLVRFHK
jgi:hypothetical protein